MKGAAQVTNETLGEKRKGKVTTIVILWGEVETQLSRGVTQPP